jgi:hypothetical protein
MHIWNERGGLSEECVSADTACFGRGYVDGLAGRFSAERAKEKGVWMEGGVIRRRMVTGVGEARGMNVEAFTNGLATRTCCFRGGGLLTAPVYGIFA